MFINKLLNFIIIDLFPKIGNGQVAENVLLEKMIRDLLESHNFENFVQSDKKKHSGENKID